VAQSLTLALVNLRKGNFGMAARRKQNVQSEEQLSVCYADCNMAPFVITDQSIEALCLIQVANLCIKERQKN